MRAAMGTSLCGLVLLRLLLFLNVGEEVDNIVDLVFLTGLDPAVICDKGL